jgi:hypothetical protein
MRGFGELIVVQLAKTFATFLVTRWFITLSTRAITKHCLEPDIFSPYSETLLT